MRTMNAHLTAVDGVSDRLAVDISNAFPTYARLAAATLDDLTEIKGIGPVVARRIKAATATAMAANSSTNKATKAAATATQATSSVAARADKAARAAAQRAAGVADTVADDAADTGDVAVTGLARFTEAAADGSEFIAKNFADQLHRRNFGPVTLPADLPTPVSRLLDLTESTVTFGLGITTGVLRKATARLR